MVFWNFGLPLINELVRGISTALAVQAGRTVCPDCAPTVHCPPCPSLTCAPGSVPVAPGPEAGFLGVLIDFCVGVATGVAACLAAWRQLGRPEAVEERPLCRALAAPAERRPAGRGVRVIDGVAAS